MSFHQQDDDDDGAGSWPGHGYTAAEFASWKIEQKKLKAERAQADLTQQWVSWAVARQNRDLCDPPERGTWKVAKQ